MRILSKINKLLSRCETLFHYIAMVAVVIMMLLVVTDATLRYAFKSPIPGSYYLTSFLLIAVVALPLAYAQRLKAHIRVDLVIGKIRGRGRASVELLILITTFGLFCIATWITGKSAVRAFVTDDFITGLVEYPIWPSKSLIPIACGILCVRLIVDIVHHARYLIHPEESGTYPES